LREPLAPQSSRDLECKRNQYLNRCFAAFVIADADGVIDVADEDFAVADPAGAGGADDGLQGIFLLVVGNDQLDFDLG
jgi:hypothetical protein